MLLFPGHHQGAVTKVEHLELKPVPMCDIGGAGGGLPYYAITLMSVILASQVVAFLYGTMLTTTPTSLALLIKPFSKAGNIVGFN